MHLSVVICGEDITLLSTRKLVLEQAGFSVTTVLGSQRLEVADGAVLVLCYTLSPPEQMEAIVRYRSRYPNAKILMLGGETRDLAYEGCEVLPAYPGPELLVQRVIQFASAASLP